MPTPNSRDDLVSLDEACLLAAGVSSGRDLSSASETEELLFLRIKTGEVHWPAGDVGKSYPSAAAAVESGELPAFVAYRNEDRPVFAPRVSGQRSRVHYETRRLLDCAQTRVDRKDFAIWLWRAHGIKSDLLPDPEALQTAPQCLALDFEPNTRGRRTLLAIIAALASHADEDLTHPHKQGGIGEVLAEKIHRLFGIQLGARRVADLLAEARDLPHEDRR